jgi:hypothetical protein
MSYVECQIIGVPYYSPSEHPPVVFMNSITAPDPAFPENEWVTVEIPVIPDDTKFVHLTGVMIITSGAVDLAETADMHLRLRRYLAPPNAYSPDYVGQVCESRTGGVRSPFAAWCPVENRKFQLHWTRSTPYPHPQHAAYGLKLYVDAYGR